MPPEQIASPMLQPLPLSIIFLIFYFPVFKPQKDKQKQHREMIANLKKNDAIVTAGGMHGVIVNIKETTVVIRVDDSVKIEIDKEAISTVKKKEKTN